VATWLYEEEYRGKGFANDDDGLSVGCYSWQE
jgi:hypothetical protein